MYGGQSHIENLQISLTGNLKRPTSYTQINSGAALALFLYAQNER